MPLRQVGKLLIPFQLYCNSRTFLWKLKDYVL